ncbi:MAG: hypothetical protein ACFFCQ_18365 [Promethearchaeota archaeon]
MAEDQAKALIAGIIAELRRKYLNPMTEEIQQLKMELQANLTGFKGQIDQLNQKMESIYMTQMNLQSRMEQMGGGGGGEQYGPEIQELTSKLTTIESLQNKLSKKLDAQVLHVTNQIEQHAIELQEVRAKLKEAPPLTTAPAPVVHEHVSPAAAPSGIASFDLSTPKGVISAAIDTLVTLPRPTANVKGTADERGECIAFRTKVRNELEKTSAALADLGVGRVKTRTTFTTIMEYANRWDKIELIDDEVTGLKSIVKILNDLKSELGY